MQVPISANTNDPPDPRLVTAKALSQLPETSLMIAAQIQHAHDRLVDPETSLAARLSAATGYSRNLIDNRDPTAGEGGKTPDVSTHGASATPGSDVVGYGGRFNRATRAQDKGRVMTPIGDHDIMGARYDEGDTPDTRK